MILELSFVRPSYHFKTREGEIKAWRTSWFDAVTAWLAASFRVEDDHCVRSELAFSKQDLRDTCHITDNFISCITESPDLWTTFMNHKLFVKAPVHSKKRWIYKLPDKTLFEYWRALIWGIQKEKWDLFKEAIWCLEELRRRKLNHMTYVMEYLGVTKGALTLEQRAAAEKTIDCRPDMQKAADRLFKEAKKKYESKGIKKTA